MKKNLNPQPLQSYSQMIEGISINVELPIEEVQRRRELLKLILAKIECQKEMGILIEKTEGEKALSQALEQYKVNLQNMVNRVTPLIRSPQNEAAAIEFLSRELKEVLAR